MVAGVGGGVRSGRKVGEHVLNIVDDEAGRGTGDFCLRVVAQDEFDLAVADNALNEIRRSGGVHRYGDGSAEQDGPEAGEPVE